MSIDLMGLALRASGFDLEGLMRQAAELGRTFAEMDARGRRIEANQAAMMAHMGLYVAPLDEAQTALIAIESRRFTDPVALDGRGVADRPIHERAA